MKRVLVIKLTSLGDLIHTLPALTDASRFDPSIQFDWVIDENFQEVATWHSSVKNIIPTNHRKWRKNLSKFSTYQALHNLHKKLKENYYDLIIDAQGNFKSAFLSLLTRGPRAGFDKDSIRERVAAFAYNRSYPVSKKAHAIERLRLLFGHALGYEPTGTPHFQIDTTRFIPTETPKTYLVFIHSAAWDTKLWSEAHWIKLIEQAVEEGHTILLPWGNLSERERAERLAISSKVIVLPKLSLSELGYILIHAEGCVSMDTGLSHLISALNIPSVTLYGPTDTSLIGTHGPNQVQLKSSLSCSPCNKKKCPIYPHKNQCKALEEIRPKKVMDQLTKTLLNQVGTK